MKSIYYLFFISFAWHVHRTTHSINVEFNLIARQQIRTIYKRKVFCLYLCLYVLFSLSPITHQHWMNDLLLLFLFFYVGDAPDEALRWLLSRIRAEPPIGLGLQTTVKAHESTKSTAFYVSAPVNT